MHHCERSEAMTLFFFNLSCSLMKDIADRIMAGNINNPFPSGVRPPDY